MAATVSDAPWWCADAAPATTEPSPSKAKQVTEQGLGGEAEDVSPIAVVEALVNGALLQVAVGGGVRVASGGPGGCRVAHVVCLSAEGCVVRAEGTAVAHALAFGEAAEVELAAAPTQSTCWIAFGSAAVPAVTEPIRPAKPAKHQQQEASITTVPPPNEQTLPCGDVALLARLAAEGGGRWRSCATSFSTMVRFFQHHDKELKWQRPAEGEQTVVSWKW